MTTYRFGDSNNGAVIRDGMADAINSILDNLEDGLGRRVLTRAEDIVDEARPQVPVRTGNLQESLDSYVRSAETEIAVGIRMGGPAAAYAYKVRFARPRKQVAGPRRKGVRQEDVSGPRQYGVFSAHAGKSVFQVLVRKPMDAAVDKLADDVVAAMVDGAAKARRR